MVLRKIEKLKSAGTVELIMGTMIFSACMIMAFGFFEISNAKKRALISAINAKILSERGKNNGDILNLLNNIENSLPKYEPKEGNDKVITYEDTNESVKGKVEGESLFYIVTSALGQLVGTFSNSGTWVIADIRGEDKLKKWRK
ncbi:MAG: hypothetical protein QXI58_05055 [Candidatus Micrarchaeia archaeon]